MDVHRSVVDKTPFYNLRVNNLGKARFLTELGARLDQAETVTINFLNAHCFNIAQIDAEYRRAINECTFLLNDGVGISIAGKMIGIGFEDNLNGTDLIPEILKLCVDRRLSIYLYGSEEGVAATAAENMQEKIQGLKIAGVCNGFIADAEDVIQRINTASADVVILGMGVPLQEKWVQSHAKSLRSVKLLVCGGAILDFEAGRVRRAPSLVRKLRLEWLFRLAQEPRRLFSRYTLGSLLFLRHIIALRR